MPPRRAPAPFTDKSLASFEAGKRTDAERRLIVTIRELQTNSNRRYVADGKERLDELVAENAYLKEQLGRLKQDCSHYRVLITATRDKTIEIFADPQVRTQVVCIPETRTEEELRKAVEWALGKVPNEFRDMVDDVGIRPELHSVHCMDKTAWRYYREHREAWAYLERLGEGVEEIVTQTKEHETSSAGTGAPPSAENIPW